MPATAQGADPLIETLPREERIRQRANELYVQRGNHSVSQLDDWLQAEEEVLSALARKAKFDHLKKPSAGRKRKAKA